MYLFKAKELFHMDLDFVHWQFYVYTLLFVGGNLFFPWLAHNFALGGPVFLPIYFFVLIGAYKFGWRVGVLTAILSPLMNTLATGMPPVAMLPSIFVKGIAMAVIASSIAKKTQALSFANLAIIILGYQAVGMVFEAVYLNSLHKAFLNVAIAYPGLIIQFLLGYLVLWLLKGYSDQAQVA